MYYKEYDTVGLHYAYKNDNMFRYLTDEQLKVVSDFVKYYILSKMNTVNYAGDYWFTGAEYNFIDDVASYTIKHRVTGEEQVVSTEKLIELLKAIGTLVDAYMQEALRAVKYVAYINRDRLRDEYISNEYPYVSQLFSVILPMTDVEVQIKRFLDAGLILPITLKTVLETKVRTRYRKQVYEDAIRKLIGSINDKDLNIYYTDKSVFIKEIRDKIIDASTESERLDLASRLTQYVDLYAGLTGYETVDIMAMVNASMKVAYYVHAKNGDRLATVNEKKKMVTGIFKKDIFFLAPEKREKLLYFAWSVTNNIKLIKKFSEFSENITVISNEAWPILLDSIKYLRSSEFLKADIYELKKGIADIKYPKKADDEIKDYEEHDKIQKVYSEYSKRSDDYSKMVTDISRKYLKFGVVLSEKQMNVLNKAYDSMIMSDSGTYNKFNADVLNKIDTMLSFYDFKSTEFKYKMMTDIKRKKCCSSKQLMYIEEWYNDYLQKKNSIIEVDEIEADEAGGDRTLAVRVDSPIEDDNIEEVADDYIDVNEPKITVPDGLVWNH